MQVQFHEVGTLIQYCRRSVVKAFMEGLKQAKRGKPFTLQASISLRHAPSSDLFGVTAVAWAKFFLKQLIILKVESNQIFIYSPVAAD